MYVFKVDLVALAANQNAIKNQDGFTSDFSVVALLTKVRSALVQDQIGLPVARVKKVMVFYDKG